MFANWCKFETYCCYLYTNHNTCAHLSVLPARRKKRHEDMGQPAPVSGCTTVHNVVVERLYRGEYFSYSKSISSTSSIYCHNYSTNIRGKKYNGKCTLFWWSSVWDLGEERRKWLYSVKKLSLFHPSVSLRNSIVAFLILS